MKHSRCLVVLSVVLLIPISPAIAQHQHHPESGRPEQLGRVTFSIACSEAANKSFERAVAMLHSFWYEEAEKVFAGVAETDPACAMAHWGLAMSLYHPIWEPPDQATLKRGLAAVQKAKALGARTAREKDYIQAIETFYHDHERLDHRTRAQSYQQAMEQLMRRHPDDVEAAVFYALALLDSATLPSDKTYVKQRRAGEILDQVFLRQPEHPGLAHYIIHSYDYPTLANRALEAARKYATIAPSVPHALHMPSHIFTRLGLWQESIASNRASATAARQYGIKARMRGSWDQELHALDYLMYAYLQGGQELEAKSILTEVSRTERAEPESFASAYALTAVPARYALERRRWSEAASLTVRPQSFPWDRYPWAEAHIYFARALGSAREGQADRARADVEKLQTIRDTLAARGEKYWAEQVDIERRAAAAWLEHAQGQISSALTLMRSAADLEDSTDKSPVTPGPIVPARELLGELLLELNEPVQALREFEASLGTSPNRLQGLYGAARAAQRAGNLEKARDFYTRLIEIGKSADGERPEFREAREFLRSDGK